MQEQGNGIGKGIKIQRVKSHYKRWGVTFRSSNVRQKRVVVSVVVAIQVYKVASSLRKSFPFYTPCARLLCPKT